MLSDWSRRAYDRVKIARVLSCRVLPNSITATVHDTTYRQLVSDTTDYLDVSSWFRYRNFRVTSAQNVGEKSDWLHGLQMFLVFLGHVGFNFGIVC